MSCGRQPADDADDDDNAELPKRPVAATEIAAPCMKCKEQRPAVIERNLLRYCKPCFRFYVRKKFRDQLQPAIVDAQDWVRRLDNPPVSILVIAKSVTATATAVDLLTTICLPKMDAKAVKAKASPFSHLEILHIEDAVADDAVPEAKAALQDIANHFALSITTLRLRDLFPAAVPGEKETHGDATDPHVAGAADQAASPVHASNVFTPTAQQSLRSSLAHSYAMQYAQNAGHRLVMLCDTSTELAATIISSIAHGQGYALGEMVSGDLISINGGTGRLIRPMANLTQEDVDFYAHHSGLHVGKYTNLPRPAGRTIDGLITSFVDGLQANFPATVSTIGKTAAKLKLRSVDGNAPRCRICCLPRDAKASIWRDVTAMTSLDELSTGKADEGALDLSGLCYGCLIPFEEALLKPNSRSRLLQLHDALPHFYSDPS